tara:strand:- start:98 stop:427 length:330 start_codon:yes stop_codon:yes gene_type:complete
VTEPSVKQARGVDGRQAKEWFDEGSFEQSITYNGILTRLDGRWTLELQWVDLDNAGHRIVLPNKVVEAIRSGYERVIDQSNSEGARKAAQTRRESGLVPFQPKNKQQAG